MHSYRNYFSTAAAAVVVSLSLTHLSFAGEALAQKTIADAQAAFDQRSAASSAAIDESLSILAGLENKSDDSDENYDVYILESRALYWKGVHTAANKEKMALFEMGQNAAESAKKINDGYADAYYFAGINLARWGEANGVIASLFKKDQLIKTMNDAMNRPTRSGEAGESIDGFGPNRTLGRVYFKLPSMFGGSHSSSVNYLKKAVDDTTYPVALNFVYYAETLSDGTTSEKAEAKQVLDNLLAQDPAAFNPARVPETLDEFEEAKLLRAKLR